MSTPAFFQGFLSHERGLFGNVVAAVPDDGLDYRPEPKARSARELIEHLIGHNLDLQELLDDGVIHHRNQVPFDSVESAVGDLDASFAALIETLGSMDEAAWLETGQFYAGDHLVMEAPRQQLAWMMLFDAVHHRGQLSTYLRPMGSKVPSIYGPSADTQGEAH
jgi:uncharacterized damage-inducible protein DinB